MRYGKREELLELWIVIEKGKWEWGFIGIYFVRLA